MRVSGLNLKAYWLSKYFSDCLFNVIPTLVVLGLLKLIGTRIDAPKYWILLVLNIFANPIFIYVMSGLFKSSASARSAVMYLYLLLGIVLPMFLMILMFVKSTRELSTFITQFFLIFPIFAIANGYLNISLRSLIASMEEGKSATRDPFDS